LADHGGEEWRAWRDRVCRRCAKTARERGEDVYRVNDDGEPVCGVCGGEPLPLTDDGRLIGRVCGACTPLPPSVAAELDGEA